MSLKKIELELDKKNKSKLSSFERENSNELLLLNAPSEDLSILNKLGLDHTLRIVQNEKNNIDAIVGLTNVFGKETYLGEDIKDLCIKYNLRLLRAESYKGKIDHELASIINDFIKSSEEKNLHIRTSYNNFFILAPENDFFETNRDNINNCTLFYRENNEYDVANEDDKFIKIHSWGKNYSPLRQLDFLFTNTVQGDEVSQFGGSILQIAILIVLFCGFWIYSCGIAFYILSFLVCIIRYLCLFDDISYIRKWNRRNEKI